MTMNKQTIEDKLNDAGELLVTLDSGDKVEFHLHDTTCGEDGVTIELADGEMSFTYDVIESVGLHRQTTEDFGFE